MSLSHYVRVCNIDRESCPELELDAERPGFSIKFYTPKEYGCYGVQIKIWAKIIELTTSQGN